MEKNKFTDPRDGQTYEIYQIGYITWMTENFRYNTEGCFVSEDGEVYYHASDLENLCPEGWHIPTSEDWGELFDYVEEDSTEFIHRASMCTIFPSESSSDKFGFSDVVAGWQDKNGSIVNAKIASRFWCADKSLFFKKFCKTATWEYPQNSKKMYGKDFKFEKDNGFGCSVRLIKD